MIQFTEELNTITESNLEGFFVNWPNPPSPTEHLEILKNSSHFFLAINKETGKVVGFINALSDNRLFAYIPLLEVLPEYKKQGIGAKLLDLMTEKLIDLYSIDLCCDKKLESYYEKFGFFKLTGMVKRNFESLEKR